MLNGARNYTYPNIQYLHTLHSNHVYNFTYVGLRRKTAKKPDERQKVKIFSQQKSAMIHRVQLANEVYFILFSTMLQRKRKRKRAEKEKEIRILHLLYVVKLSFDYYFIHESFLSKCNGNLLVVATKFAVDVNEL